MGYALGFLRKAVPEKKTIVAESDIQNEQFFDSGREGCWDSYVP